MFFLRREYYLTERVIRMKRTHSSQDQDKASIVFVLTRLTSDNVAIGELQYDDASRIDVVLIMIPYERNFVTSIGKKNRKTDKIKGQIGYLFEIE